jgi:hypothetical protein
VLVHGADALFDAIPDANELVEKIINNKIKNRFISVPFFFITYVDPHTPRATPWPVSPSGGEFALRSCEKNNRPVKRAVGEFKNQIKPYDSAAFMYTPAAPQPYFNEGSGTLRCKTHRNIYFYDAFAPGLIWAFDNPNRLHFTSSFKIVS